MNIEHIRWDEVKWVKMKWKEDVEMSQNSKDYVTIEKIGWGKTRKNEVGWW